MLELAPSAQQHLHTQLDAGRPTRQLRLGFAIAAHMNYEVIFIDEVLKFCGRVYLAKELAKRMKED